MPATAVAHRDDADHRGVTINLRASAQVRDLIDRAAALLGQNRSVFMLDSARLRAEDVVLDQKLFSLNDKQYQDFLDLFPRRGQEASTPWRLALVTILQNAEGLTDRQAADAVRTRIDWKYA